MSYTVSNGSNVPNTSHDERLLLSGNYHKAESGKAVCRKQRFAKPDSRSLSTSPSLACRSFHFPLWPAVYVEVYLYPTSPPSPCTHFHHVTCSLSLVLLPFFRLVLLLPVPWRWLELSVSGVPSRRHSWTPVFGPFGRVRNKAGRLAFAGS